MGEREGPFLHNKHSISIRVLGVRWALCDSHTAALCDFVSQAKPLLSLTASLNNIASGLMPLHTGFMGKTQRFSPK